MRLNSPTVQAIRWILVLPAAVAAYFVVQLLAILINEMTEYRNSDWYMQLINSAIGSFGAVWIGAKVAPRSHFPVSLVLVGINGLFILTVCILALIRDARIAWWWLALNGLVGIAASVAACLLIKEDKPKTA